MQNRRRDVLRRWRLPAFYSAFIILHSSFAFADPKVEDIFKSTSENLGQPIDSSKILALAVAVAGMVMLISLLALRRQRIATPRALNHTGKLTREIAKTIGLKPAEMKQLKTLADSQDVNPLTLLLCPSLLAKAVKEQPQKVNREVIASLARRVTSSRE